MAVTDRNASQMNKACCVCVCVLWKSLWKSLCCGTHASHAEWPMPRPMPQSVSMPEAREDHEINVRVRLKRCQKDDDVDSFGSCLFFSNTLFTLWRANILCLLAHVSPKATAHALLPLWMWLHCCNRQTAMTAKLWMHHIKLKAADVDLSLIWVMWQTDILIFFYIKIKDLVLCWRVKWHIFSLLTFNFFSSFQFKFKFKYNS